MKITNSKDSNIKPPIHMIVYGEPGIGKTTFAAESSNAILFDCERGTKYLGLRGIDIDIGHVQDYEDARQGIYKIVKGDKYDTVIIDPVGELMDKIKQDITGGKNSKLVQSDGTPTMAGWGMMKEKFISLLKWLRDSGKNVIVVAHVEEKEDEGRIVKRPKIQTKVSEDMIGMFDIVGYMQMGRDKEGNKHRIITVDPESDKFVAKDRTGQLIPHYDSIHIPEPDFDEIVEVCSGGAGDWSKEKKEKSKKKKIETKEEKETEEPEEKEEPKELDEDKVKDMKDQLKESFTKKRLKQMAENRDLKVSGNKDELADRIARDQLKRENSEDDSEAKSRLKDKIKKTNGKGN